MYIKWPLFRYGFIKRYTKASILDTVPSSCLLLYISISKLIPYFVFFFVFNVLSKRYSASETALIHPAKAPWTNATLFFKLESRTDRKCFILLACFSDELKWQPKHRSNCSILRPEIVAENTRW